ncbi:MAG: AMP-binding protein [Myxococcota bacterium]
MSYLLFAKHRPTDALAADGRTVAELLGTASEIGRALPSAEPDAELMVLCRDRFLFAASLVAAWEAGFAVALPPNPQPETVRALRQRSQIRNVPHDGEGEKGLAVRPFGATPKVDVPMPSAIDPARHLATVYTSGSTGPHKPCPKNAAQLLGEAETLVETFGLAGARVFATVPAHHIYGLLFGVLVPSLAGGSFFSETALHAQPVANALARGAQVLVSVPAHLAGLRVLDEASLPALARVFSSGAPLPTATAAMLEERFSWLTTEVLGSSETGGIGHRFHGAAGKEPWTPFPEVRVWADESGRMLLQSPLLGPEVGLPFRGGDKIRVLPDGRFEHLGRVDGVLKMGSTRVSVAELEERLLSIDGVQDAAVIPREVGGSRGWETWAVLVAPTLDVAAVRKALSRWLSPVVLPRRYRFVEALPRQANGKLRRADLRRCFEDTP